MSDEVASWSEQRDVEHERRREGLAACGFDGPFDIRTGGDFMSILAGTQQYGVCLTCGAMVMLGDPMERPGQPAIERGIYLHRAWHDEETR